MKQRIMFVLWCALLSAGIVHAQNACPWFTEGSAAGLLGGPVTATTKLIPSGQGSCTFSSQQEATVYLLEISVTNSAHGFCPGAAQKLGGIGNEALICRSENLLGETVEEVNSRVRAMYFTARLTIRGTSASVMPPAKQRDIVEQMAEQVAGNLY